jgi:hypothetical protein
MTISQALTPRPATLREFFHRTFEWVDQSPGYREDMRFRLRFLVVDGSLNDEKFQWELTTVAPTLLLLDFVASQLRQAGIKNIQDYLPPFESVAAEVLEALNLFLVEGP